MFKTLKISAAAGLLMGFAAYANAAPVSAVGPLSGAGADSAGNLVEVHGRHRRCRAGYAGWHRHRWDDGERIRIPCRSYRYGYRHRYRRDCFRIGDHVLICPD